MKKPTRKGLGRNVSTKTYPEIERGLDDQLPRLKRIVRRPGRRCEQGHVLDAMLAYLLTRAEGDQAHILCEGRRIVSMLDRVVSGIGAPLMPGSHGVLPAGLDGVETLRSGSAAVLKHGISIPDGMEAPPAIDVRRDECDDQPVPRRRGVRPRR